MYNMYRPPVTHSLDQHWVDSQAVSVRSTPTTKTVPRIEGRIHAYCAKTMFQPLKENIVSQRDETLRRRNHKCRVRGPSMRVHSKSPLNRQRWLRDVPGIASKGKHLMNSFVQLVGLRPPKRAKDGRSHDLYITTRQVLTRVECVDLFHREVFLVRHREES